MCIFRTSHINRNKELKSLFFCYWSSSAKHVWIFIFQSIWNLTRNHFPKSFKRKVQQVASLENVVLLPGGGGSPFSISISFLITANNAFKYKKIHVVLHLTPQKKKDGN